MLDAAFRGHGLLQLSKEILMKTSAFNQIQLIMKRLRRKHLAEFDRRSAGLIIWNSKTESFWLVKPETGMEDRECTVSNWTEWNHIFYRIFCFFETRLPSQQHQDSNVPPAPYIA
jgi:hypothetical protein